MTKDNSFTRHFNKSNAPITLAAIIGFSFSLLGCAFLASSAHKTTTLNTIISIFRVGIWLLVSFGLLRKSTWAWWSASILPVLAISSIVSGYIATSLIKNYAIPLHSKFAEIKSDNIFGDPWLYIYIFLLTLLLSSPTRQVILPKPIAIRKSLTVLLSIFLTIVVSVAIYGVIKLSPTLIS